MHAQKDHLVQINANQTGYVGAVELNSPYEGGDQTWVVGHDRKWTMQKGDDTIIVQKGDKITRVEKGRYATQVEQDKSTQINKGNYSLDVKMGDISIKADLGKIEIEAMQSIQLKVGTNTIKLDQMGVTFDVMMFDSKAKISANFEGLMTSIKGNAMLQLSGGIIMIG